MSMKNPSPVLDAEVAGTPAKTSHHALEEKILGVFSTAKSIMVGFGHTKKRIPQNLLFYAEENDDGLITLQPLNPNFIPSGKPQTLEKDVLLNNFQPEPSIYIKSVAPALRELNKTIARGERYLRNNESFSAEFEFKNALRIDEENIRATFGLGQTYLKRGDKERGHLVFRRLVRLDAAFEPEHKHLFNEFGMSLRKMGMFVQALKYYARARRLSKTDEHLAFNMARVLYDQGKDGLALKFVNTTLTINPSLPEALQFQRHLEQKLGISDNKHRQGEAGQYDMSI